MSALLAGQRVRLLLLRRRLRSELSRGRARAIGLVALGAGLALVVFVAAFAGGWFVRWKHAPELLSTGTTAALTGLGLALVLSTLGHAAQAFFTAKDLWLWDSAPTGIAARFLDRLTETALAALPAALAVGSVGLVGLVTGGGLGLVGALRAVIAVVAVAPLPLALGVALAHVGGAVLPAGRLRRVSLLLLGVAVAAALVWFRRARVERLLTEDGAHEILTSARSAGALGPAWLPPQKLAAFVVDADVGALAMGAVAVAVAVAGAFLAHVALYDRARKLAVDEAPTGVLRGSLSARMLDAITRPAPRDLRPMLRKDLLVFLRDPGQWSQVVLLLGVGVLYVVNASALAEGLRPLGEFGAMVLLAMHTGIVGFVGGGLAARFAFPQVGLEGPAVWIVDGAPLSPRRLLWTKWLSSLPVVVFFPSALALIGGVVVGFPLFHLVWSTALIAALCLCIAAAATARGALHPLFDAASLSELAMGPGAISTMVLTTALAFGTSCAAFAAAGAWYARPWIGGGAGGVAWAIFVVAPLAASLRVARRAFVQGEEALRARREVGSSPSSASPERTIDALA